MNNNATNVSEAAIISGNIHCWMHHNARFVLHEDGRYYCTECKEEKSHEDKSLSL